MVGPLLSHWKQWNTIQVVVIGDQDAIAGKFYWVDVETADALSLPASNGFRTAKNEESATSSRTTSFAEYTPWVKRASRPELSTIRPKSHTFNLAALGIWIVLYKVTFRLLLFHFPFSIWIVVCFISFDFANNFQHTHKLPTSTVNS